MSFIPWRAQNDIHCRRSWNLNTHLWSYAINFCHLRQWRVFLWMPWRYDIHFDEGIFFFFFPRLGKWCFFFFLNIKIFTACDHSFYSPLPPSTHKLLNIGSVDFFFFFYLWFPQKKKNEEMSPSEFSVFLGVSIFIMLDFLLIFYCSVSFIPYYH